MNFCLTCQSNVTIEPVTIQIGTFKIDSVLFFLGMTVFCILVAYIWQKISEKRDSLI
mgnify:CR=1 FL=1